MDYIAVIAVARGCYVGYKSGLFVELLRVVSYLIVAIVTFRFHSDLAQFLTLNTFLNSVTADAVSVSALIIGTFLLCKLVSVILLKILKIGEGGFVNQLIGLLIGAVRWFILLSLLFMLIDQVPFLSQLKTDIHTRSLLGPRIVTVAPTLFEFLSNVSPQLTVAP